jgi:putative membrane protein
VNTARLPRPFRPLSWLGGGFDSDGLRSAYLFFICAVLFFFPFGLLFVAGGLLPERFSWTASVVIALTAAATLLSETRARPVRQAMTQFLVICSVLFAVEYLGVRSGVPFGRYAYTDVLGFRVLGVPAAISLAWYSTVVNAWRVARGLVFSGGPASAAGAVALTGVLTLSLDILLEPMAAFVTGYWVWESGAIPLQNYSSWFLFSVLIAFLLSRTTPGTPMRDREMIGGAVVILTTQSVLFCATILNHGVVLPVVVSGALAGAAVFAARALAPARRPR